jgi:hypothetical protein
MEPDPTDGSTIANRPRRDTNARFPDSIPLIAHNPHSQHCFQSHGY